MKRKTLRIAGLMGIVSPLIGLTMISLSIWFSPWFRFTEHALSDLGATGFGSLIFNFALPTIGALLMLFITGLFEATKGSYIGKLGSLLYLAASLALVGLGPANIKVKPWHKTLSICLFIALPLAIAAISLWAYRNKMKKYAYTGAIAAIIAAVVWAFDWPGIAIPETIAVLATTAWQIPLANWMYTQRNDID